MNERRQGEENTGARGEPRALRPGELRALWREGGRGVRGAQASPPAPLCHSPARRFFCGKLSEKNLSQACLLSRPLGRWGLLEGAHPAQTNRGGGLGRARLQRALQLGGR